MKETLKIIFLAILLQTMTFASEYIIISNNNMKNLSKAEIKAIFLKKITIVNNIKVVPISLGSRDSLRMDFEDKILKMSFNRLKSYWAKQHYQGHRPPLTLKSQDSVKAFVKKVAGAIGYIKADKLDSSIKEIYRWSD